MSLTKRGGVVAAMVPKKGKGLVCHAHNAGFVQRKECFGEGCWFEYFTGLPPNEKRPFSKSIYRLMKKY
jgi:hypothetical protein